MPTIHDLRTALTEARTEADHHERTRTDADRARTDAHRAAIDHEAAAQDAKIFGRIPTPGSRRRERLAAECRTEMERQQAAHIAASPAANDAHAEVRYAERRLERSLDELAGDTADLDREQQREAMADQRVHDAVESDQISTGEAYAADGLVRPEIHEREVRTLEADDGLDGPWSAPADEDDGGYAQAAAEAREDQLAVRDADLSIDAGTRTHEEVYTPEGHIRQHLLRDEPEAETEPAPERDRGREEAPQREQRTMPAMEFDEPF